MILARGVCCCTRSLLRTAVVAGALLLTVTSAARATPLTFAQFTQKDVTAQNFVYTNASVSATFNTITGGDPVTLIIAQQVLPPGMNSVQDAHVTLASTTTSPATQNGNTLSERFPTATNTIQIKLDNPFQGKTNFLTVTYSDTLSGTVDAT